MVACYRTFFSADVTGNWDEELVEVLPAGLRVVSHNGKISGGLMPSLPRRR